MTADVYLLRLAYEEAAKSPDPSNQNGAVLAAHFKPLVRDFNRFPHGFKFTAEHLTNRDKKLKYIEHAERNVVYSAAKRGVLVYGTTLYCPWFACMACARAIIQAGVVEVIGHAERMAMTPDRWKADVDEAVQYLRDCNIKLRIHEGPVGGPVILVNGEPWQP
jgi:dCMP deaminase